MANDLDVLDASFAPGPGTLRGDARGPARRARRDPCLPRHARRCAAAGHRAHRIPAAGGGCRAARLGLPLRRRGHGPADAGVAADRRPVAHHGRPCDPAGAGVRPLGVAHRRRSALAGRVGRTARRPDRRGQGPVRDQGLPDRRGQPGLPRRRAGRDDDGARGERPAARRRVTARDRPHRRVRVQHRRRQRALRHPAQRRPARGAARRLVERTGLRRRRRGRPTSASPPTPPGSVRVPASYQGLWGLRTTHGLVPRQGLLPLAQSFDTIGWLTRDGETLQRVADWCLSYDGSPSTEHAYGASESDLPWRFAVPEEVRASVEPETLAAFDRRARAPARDGCRGRGIRLDRRPRRLPRAVPHGAGRRGVAQQRRLAAGASGCRRPRRSPSASAPRPR